MSNAFTCERKNVIRSSKANAKNYGKTNEKIETDVSHHCGEEVGKIGYVKEFNFYLQRNVKSTLTNHNS